MCVQGVCMSSSKAPVSSCPFGNDVVINHLTIYASLRGLRIKTTGIALEDGTLDELVRVKNKKSGKVLNARVDGVESVQVNI